VTIASRASSCIVNPAVIKIGFGWDLMSLMMDIDVGAFAHIADGRTAPDGASIPFWGTETCEGALFIDEGGYLVDDDVTLRIDFSRIPEGIQSYEIVWRIRDADIRNQQFNMVENAYMRIADKPFRWDALDHPIDTQDMTSSQLLVARLVRSNSGWSLIKETRQL
jgi:tellurium resistance protein TerD